LAFRHFQILPHDLPQRAVVILNLWLIHQVIRIAGKSLGVLSFYSLPSVVK
jgi:hypothetical protein